MSKNDKKSIRLAYKYDIYVTKPLSRKLVYIDAISGNVLLERELIHEQDVPAQGVSIYNGMVPFTANQISANQYYLQSNSLGVFMTTRDRNNTPSSNANTVVSSSATFIDSNDVVQVHYGVEATYNYFKAKHGRDSYDGNKSPIYASICNDFCK